MFLTFELWFGGPRRAARLRAKPTNMEPMKTLVAEPDTGPVVLKISEPSLDKTHVKHQMMETFCT